VKYDQPVVTKKNGSHLSDSICISEAGVVAYINELFLLTWYLVTYPVTGVFREGAISTSPPSTFVVIQVRIFWGITDHAIQ